MRMKMAQTIPVALLALAGVTMNPAPSLAKTVRSNVRFTNVGEPIAGGSWHQAFLAETYMRSSFDSITGVMDASGPGFEDPGFSFEPDTGWSSADYSTSRIVVADGPATNALNWIANFEGDSDTSPSFGIDFFLTTHVDGDSVLVGRGRAFWTGGIEGDWMFSGDTKASWRFVNEWMADAVAVAQVPLPGAQLLGLLGMSLVGWVRRRTNRVGGCRPA